MLDPFTRLFLRWLVCNLDFIMFTGHQEYWNILKDQFKLDYDHNTGQGAKVAVRSPPRCPWARLWTPNIACLLLHALEWHVKASEMFYFTKPSDSVRFRMKLSLWYILTRNRAALKKLSRRPESCSHQIHSVISYSGRDGCLQERQTLGKDQLPSTSA